LFNFIVKKTGPVEYTLFSEKGFAVYVLVRCHSKEEAMERAAVWASSWQGATVRMEDGQSK
jgi:hypothetical protein